MTKKDYIQFASLFAGELAVNRDFDLFENPVRGEIRNIILSTADIFAQDNPRFDREKFYVACGLTKEGALA